MGNRQRRQVRCNGWTTRTSISFYSPDTETAELLGWAQRADPASPAGISPRVMIVNLTKNARLPGARNAYVFRKLDAFRLTYFQRNRCSARQVRYDAGCGRYAGTHVPREVCACFPLSLH